MNWKIPKVFAVKHKNSNTRMLSRSGGVFTALSDEVLNDKGVIYGCVLSEDFQAVHIRAEDKDMRNRMRGSKYIQSKLGDTYRNVEADLKSGRKVLFSGTSCQILGLLKFLDRDYADLLCVDIVCHGVPSPLVWKRYLSWQERKNSARVISVDFRNKKDFGWHDHVETLTMENGNKINSRVFRTLFMGRNILRPSCFKCPFKSIMHPGDITIADYWGIEKAVPGFDDNKGVSLVLINNEQGERAFEKAKEHLIWKSAKIEDSMQPSLLKPFDEPLEREKFWRDFQSLDFGKIAKKYGGAGIRDKVFRELRIIKKKIIG